MDSSSSIQSKLRNLKTLVKKWNSSKTGNIEGRISDWENKQDIADLENKDRNTKQEIRLRLEELYKIKSSMLCQKARVNWQLNGEKNSKFFHRIINKRRRQNAIHFIRIDNNLVDNPRLISKEFLKHFKSFLGVKPVYEPGDLLVNLD